MFSGPHLAIPGRNAARAGRLGRETTRATRTLVTKRHWARNGQWARMIDGRAWSTGEKNGAAGLAAPFRVEPRSADDLLAQLLDLGLLAAQIAEVVELGPAYVATGDDLDAVQYR